MTSSFELNLYSIPVLSDLFCFLIDTPLGSGITRDGLVLLGERYGELFITFLWISH